MLLDGRASPASHHAAEPWSCGAFAAAFPPDVRRRLCLAESRFVSCGLCPLPPVFDEDGPPFVVAPAAGDLQVTSRVAFLYKAGAFHECNRRRVFRLDVCFESVEFQLNERVTKSELQRLSHVSLARELFSDLITDIRTPKPAMKDLAQRDRSHHRTNPRTTD